jgi:hypothetical protein
MISRSANPSSEILGRSLSIFQNGFGAAPRRRSAFPSEECLTRAFGYARRRGMSWRELGVGDFYGMKSPEAPRSEGHTNRSSIPWPERSRKDIPLRHHARSASGARLGAPLAFARKMDKHQDRRIYGFHSIVSKY